MEEMETYESEIILNFEQTYYLDIEELSNSEKSELYDLIFNTDVLDGLDDEMQEILNDKIYDRLQRNEKINKLLRINEPY